jgi:PAS domain S-box-containing protein
VTDPPGRRFGAVLGRSLRPPIGDPRFWLIQALVILIAAAFWAAVLSDRWQLSIFWGGELLALFLLPVVYAATNFGLAGALATAVWVSVLTLPAVPMAKNAERASSTIVEVAVFLAVALFVGDRVERETILRRDAEAARGAMRQSEARVRSLFENSPAATLQLDPDGAVREANPAAAALFGRGRDDLVGAALAELVGAEAAAAIRSGARSVIELAGADGERRFLRPVVSSGPGAGAFQLVFLDVSEERRRLGVKDAYAASVVKAQEEERARIAQELHDEPLQTVVHLYRLLDRLATAPDGRDDVRLGLGEARRVAERIAEELRRLARGLRPASLEDLGLVTALGRLVADADGRDSLHAHLRVEGEPRRLDRLVELGLFRIAQEAVRNVERHARADQVEVGLRFDAEAVELTVVDDGRGLPPAILADGEPHRLGLVGMEERAALLGGRFEIEPRPPHGTRVRASIPAG